ncbi:MAG: transporter substrate-binding domain-containing protein, partial [Clostridiales bacterium]|nr:transporter substrate-binding domain-containing protein [Clostridiales bacterium]
MGARTPYRLVTILMLTAMLLTAFSGCAGGGGASADGDEFGLYTSFRDVPGITADEIEAVEALQAAYKSDGEPFKYGMSSTSEVFLDENGAVGGFTGYFCQWLSQLFEIPFEPVILEWTDVHAGFGTGGIDFSGAITRSAEREAAGYIMTDPIVNRQIRYYTLDGYEPAAFEEGRRPRYGFLELSVVNSFVEPYLTEDYEPVFVNNYETAYEMLQNGELDIFYTTTAADAFFSERSDIQDRDFLPVIFQPVSLSTRKAELAPIISVVQKVLQSDRAYQLTEMYRQGQQDFSRMLLFERLTAEERQYIKDHPVIPYAAEVDNYPISFYNQHENKWQGIAEDVLNEASRLTGLTFEKVSDISDVWSTIFHMLESGEASVVSELMRNEEREGRFLWPQTPLLTDHYAFISLMDLREVAINEVTYLRVGIVADSAYADAFRKWFPDHSNTTWFSTINDAMDALDDNEIDLVMASEKQFLALMSYNESSGHKINLMMDFSYESLLGFNINEPLLCSIIEKAMDLIDVEGITDTWTRMDYDYRLQVAQARQPLLLALSGLLLVILVLTAALLYRNSTAEKRLKILVDQRTNELMDQTVTLSTVLNTIPDLIFCKDLDSNFTRINRSMEIFYGVTEEQARGKKDIHAYSIPPEKSEFFRSMDIKTAQERKQLKYEEVTKNAKGEQCIMETLKVPIIKNNVVTGTLGISRDVTERREMEEATKAASQAKTSFLANMSHELRTPLNVIIGLADLMLEDEALPVYLKSNLVSIASSGGTVLSIINDVLDISKIESGKLSIINTEYHVPSLINDTAIMTKTHIGDKPISFSLNIGENLPEVLIGDELRIKQILNNLLSNAVKYTNRGSIILTMQCSNEPDPEDGTVILSLGVKDTGIGISGEDIEPIFTDYFQANAQPGRKADGTGLGLSITRRLAEAMGGTINVESELGKGSNFQVTIKQQYAG